MPYLVGSLIAIVTAMTILFTRYEADDSTIKAELENMRVMFSMVDGFVENCVITDSSCLDDINFEKLNIAGLLINNSVVSGNGLLSTVTFPHNDVAWQIIPNKDASNSYKLLVNMRANAGLMSKAIFSENFSGREFCEKSLFGTAELTLNQFDDTDDFENSGTGTNSDGLFVCIVFK